jgi:outer membrane protein assembly factor BamB
VSTKGNKLWEAIVPGIAEGTPQIGADGNSIYVTHNDIGPDGEYTVGKLSLIRNNQFGLVTQIDLDGAGLFGIMDRPAPFSPLSAAYHNEKSVQKLYFGESWGKGESSFGFLYEFNGTHVIGLRRADFSTITPPVLSADWKSMWVGGTASSVHAWVRNKPFTSPPTWSSTLGSSKKPLLHPPILSAENNMLFVLTHDRKIFCLDAMTGDKRWSNDGRSLSPNVIHLSGDETILFAIGTDKGNVTQFSARTGRILFELSCHEIRDSEFCAMPVEGGVSVSHSGDQINYASLYGDVYLLTLDPPDLLFSPTVFPSVAPTNDPTITSTANPSQEPSLSRSEKPSFSSKAPSKIPTSAPNAATTILPSSDQLASTSVFPSVGTKVPSQPTDDSNVPSPFAISPAWSPAWSPSMPFFSPATTDVTPTGKPVVSLIKFPSGSSTAAPSLLGTSISPAMVREESKMDLQVPEVQLASLMDAQESVSTNHSVVAVFAALLLIVLTAVAALGILIGRMWERHADKWRELPTVNKDGNRYDQLSYDLQARYFD